MNISKLMNIINMQQLKIEHKKIQKQQVVEETRDRRIAKKHGCSDVLRDCPN